jgi:hypothetical protein
MPVVPHQAQVGSRSNPSGPSRVGLARPTAW